MATFCSNCGAALNENAKFCHVCGVAVGSGTASASAPPNKLFWAPVVASLLAVVVLVAVQFGSRDQASSPEPEILSAPGRPPDISQMTPQERADRLFDRVMRYTSEGKNDSASFFAPMAMTAIEAIGPLDNHRRYDIGLIALMTGDVPVAKAQSDTILQSRPTHLLGLALAARVADAQKNSAAAAAFRKKLIAAEAAERAANLPEYSAHDNDVAEALLRARGK